MLMLDSGVSGGRDEDVEMGSRGRGSVVDAPVEESEGSCPSRGAVEPLDGRGLGMVWDVVLE